MIKTLRFTGLVKVGALFLAGAVLWSLESGPPATERENAYLSVGSSAYDRVESSRPLTVSREITKNTSPSLQIGDLTEPPPSIQAAQPVPPERLVAVTQRDIAGDKPLTSMLTASVNRDSEASPKGERETSFVVGSLTEKRLAMQRAPARYGDSITSLAPPPVAATRLGSESDDSIVHRNQVAEIAATPSVESVLGAANSNIGEALTDEDAELAPAVDEIGPASEQPRSRLTSDEGEIPGSTTSQPDAAEEGRNPPSSDRHASRSVGVDAGIPSPAQPDALESEAAEAPKQREASDPDTPQPVSSETIGYTERLLDLLGYTPGPIDDEIDPQTEQAILAFQKDIGHETTGQIDGPLVAALEARLFTFLQQYIKTERWRTSDIPSVKNADRPTAIEETAKAPSGNPPPGKTVANADKDVPANSVTPGAPTPEPGHARVRTKKPAEWREVQQAAIREQQVRLEPRSERVVEKAEENIPNAFEACETSGQQKDYVKLDTGFVPCDEFSFDARATR